MHLEIHAMARLKEKKSTNLKAKRRSLPDLDNTYTKGREIALPQQKSAPTESDEEDEPETADHDVDMNGIMDDDDDDEMEKDDVEEELERLVFGDSAGFREGLRDFGGAAVDDDTEDAQDGGLEGIADNDLFFTDVGGDDAPVLGQTEDEEEEKDRAAAAWEDSDDERVVVSLASVPRLRKLRRTEGEDLVTGREYMRRLRRQFEMLNPVPDWAVDATRPAKKRKVMNADDEGDMEVDDEEDVVAEPLGALLRDGGTLVRRSEAAGGKKRKLRPETLDIQRTKDIEGTQPVSLRTSCTRHEDTANTEPVRNYLSVFPPRVAFTAFFWSRFDTLPSSHPAISPSAITESITHLPSRQRHSSRNIRISPKRHPSLPLCSSPLLSRLGSGIWSCGKGH